MWTPRQAARLLAEQHPLRPQYIAEDAEETGLARHVLDLALSFPDCRGERSPADWVRWAINQKLHINSALLDVAQGAGWPQPAQTDAPMFATLQEASDWLAQSGVVRSPKQIIEDGAKRLVAIRAGLPDGAYIPFARTRKTTPEDAAVFAAFGDTCPDEVTEFGQLPAQKTEVLTLTPADCVQFLQTNEARIRGEGFADGTTTSRVLEEFGKVLTVKHMDALRIQGQDLASYLVVLNAQSQAGESVRYRETRTPAPLSAMVSPGGVAPTRLTRWDVKTWRSWDAALLVHGFDPDTFGETTHGAQVPHCTGLCGTVFTGDDSFHRVRKLLRVWEDDHPNQERTTPADFIAWCKCKGVDTGWLRGFEAPTAQPPIESAARREQPQSGTPQGGRPRVLWRVFIQENLGACIAAQDKGGPRGLIKFMCEHGASHRIHENKSDPDTFTYENEMGDRKPVVKKTIQTAISELKRARS